MTASSSFRTLTRILPKRPAFLRFAPDGDLLVSGYQISEGGAREGGLHVFSSSSLLNCTTNPSLKDDQYFETSGGIFRFEPLHADYSQVLASLSNGKVAILDRDQNNCSEIIVSPETVMSCDVAVKGGSSAFAGMSSGEVIEVDLVTGKTGLRKRLHRLDYAPNEDCPVWSIDYREDGSVLSGGDDGRLYMWDTREGTFNPIASTKFEMGVTFIGPQSANSLIVGSYDENIRVLDTRNGLKTASEMKTAGGVWHLERREKGGWIASCMYGGWIIIDPQLHPIAKDEVAGKELLYGVGLSPNEKTLACCTFNDYKLSLSEVNGAWWNDYGVV